MRDLQPVTPLDDEAVVAGEDEDVDAAVEEVETVHRLARLPPQELVLVRRSHVGFTGFELATLSLWLDTPGFPFEFDLPAPIPSMKSRAGTNSPAARAPAGPAPAKATITPLPPKR